LLAYLHTRNGLAPREPLLTRHTSSSHTCRPFVSKAARSTNLHNRNSLAPREPLFARRFGGSHTCVVYRLFVGDGTPNMYTRSCSALREPMFTRHLNSSHTCRLFVSEAACSPNDLTE
jgi:hypothetical protein